MDFYELSLNSKLPIVCLITLIVLCFGLVGWLVGRKNIAFRSLLFDYSPLFAFSFFFIALFEAEVLQASSLVAGLLFELVVLILFLYLFFRYFKYSVYAFNYDKLLWLIFLIKVPMLFFLIFQPGFGIFHEEGQARISFLENNTINKYVVYLWFTLMVVEAVAISNTYACFKKLKPSILFIFFIELLYSTLIGSKGGVIMWGLIVIAMTPYSLGSFFMKKRHIRLALPALSVFILVIGLGARQEGIKINEFIELAANRFFLNNDARALSLDFYSSDQSVVNFIASAFRGVASIVGLEVNDPPLGNVIFERAFGVTDGRGSNASLIALINYYLPNDFKIMASLIFSILCTMMVCFFVFLESVAVRSPALKIILIALFANLIRVFSQDFLAFPLVLMSTLIVVVVLFLIGRDRTFGSVYE